MPQTHFRSMKATQNKSDVTNRFGVRDIILVVITCFIRKSDRFEVIRDFRSLIMAKIRFQTMEAPQNKSNVTNRFCDRDFALAVCTCFVRKCGRFEAFRHFRSVIHGVIPFPVDGNIAEQN
jgi:hypothetical protein